MRGIYLLFLLALAPSVKAQDYCKRVIKETSDDKTQVDYSSPTSPLAPITVKRVINTNPEWAVDNFTAVFQIVSPIDSIYTQGADGSQKEKIETKLVVEFDDNTKFVDDTIAITHDFTEDRTAAIRNLYYPVTDASVRDFTTKKIKKFTLAGTERIISADSANAIMHYFQCIKEGK